MDSIEEMSGHTTENNLDFSRSERSGGPPQSSKAGRQNLKTKALKGGSARPSQFMMLEDDETLDEDQLNESKEVVSDRLTIPNHQLSSDRK